MYTILRHRGCDSQVLLPDSYSSVHYGTSRESNVTRGPLAAGLSFRPISAITLSAPRWSAGKKIEDEKKKLRKRRKERFRCLRGCSEDSVLLSRTLSLRRPVFLPNPYLCFSDSTIDRQCSRTVIADRSHQVDPTTLLVIVPRVFDFDEPETGGERDRKKAQDTKLLYRRSRPLTARPRQPASARRRTNRGSHVRTFWPAQVYSSLFLVRAVMALEVYVLWVVMSSLELSDTHSMVSPLLQKKEPPGLPSCRACSGYVLSPTSWRRPSSGRPLLHPHSHPQDLSQGGRNNV